MTGKCAEPGPKLTYNANSKPESRLTVIVDNGKGEGGFSLFVPVFVYGNGAEAAAAEVDAGDTIAVDGRLAWKSTLKKDGSKLGLCVTCFSIEMLAKAEVPVGVTADLEPAPEPEPTAKRRRDQKWKPEPAASN